MQDFEKDADVTLQSLRRALDAADLDEAEVELEMGILSIEFADKTKYIINSHRAARQIWMAADRSAWHFDLPAAGDSSAAWKAAKSGDELWSTLERMLSKKLGKELRLARS